MVGSGLRFIFGILLLSNHPPTASYPTYRKFPSPPPKKKIGETAAAPLPRHGYILPNCPKSKKPQNLKGQKQKGQKQKGQKQKGQNQKGQKQKTKTAKTKKKSKANEEGHGYMEPDARRCG